MCHLNQDKEPPNSIRSSLRYFLCSACSTSVYICSHCDNGHALCKECSDCQLRKKQLHNTRQKRYMSQPGKKEHKSSYDAKRYLNNKNKRLNDSNNSSGSNYKYLDSLKNNQATKLQCLFSYHDKNSTDASCFLLKRCGVIQLADNLPKCAVFLKEMSCENVQVEVKGYHCSYCGASSTGKLRKDYLHTGVKRHF